MKLLCLLPLVIFFLGVHAQERIDSDRPDQTDGTHVINPGEIQIESDVYYNEFQTEKPALISSTLIRIGVLNYSEFRLVLEEGSQRDHFTDATAQGVFPLAIGSKVKLVKNHKWIPDISAIGTVQIPITSKSNEMQMLWAPFFALAYEKQIEKFSLDVNTGIKGAAFKIAYSWQAASSLRYELTRKLMLFTEYFGQYSSDFIPMHNADCGVIYYPRTNFQICASIGSTLFYEEYNRFLLFGFAVRLPN